MISVLCPSRGRPEALARALASLRNHAEHPYEFEFLVRLDRDDPRLAEYPESVVGEPLGYAGLNTYYHDLAERAQGDWLLLWNDDALMLTDDWDAMIGRRRAFRLLGPRCAEHDLPYSIVPVVPRRWFEKLGHLSLNTQIDAWLGAVAHELGIFRWLPVEITHDRADLTGNNDDATFAARDYQTETFYSPLAHAQRVADARALRSLL